MRPPPEVATCMCPAQANGFTRSANATMRAGGRADRADCPLRRGPRSAGATKHEAVPIYHVAAVIRSLHLVSAMACPNCKKRKQECETHRRQLGEFQLKKIPNWQRDDKTVCLVRGKQKAILEAQELMDWHSTNCEECKRSASPRMKLFSGDPVRAHESGN
jgi:hypothetical protein